jgi:predicted nucleic acid-binding protein
MRTVTTPSGSERFVVDSTGWVEYLADGPKAPAFAAYLEKPESLFLPTIVVYEVYKKLLRERRDHLAQEFLSGAFNFHERIVPLDTSLAELAARISLETKLAMADAIIYAAAKTHRATLITSDTHFSGLDFVTLI